MATLIARESSILGGEVHGGLTGLLDSGIATFEELQFGVQHAFNMEFILAGFVAGYGIVSTCTAAAFALCLTSGVNS